MRAQPGSLTLEADKSRPGPFRFVGAMFFKPIGQRKAGSIVVRVVLDGLKEAEKLRLEHVRPPGNLECSSADPGGRIVPRPRPTHCPPPVFSRARPGTQAKRP